MVNIINIFIKIYMMCYFFNFSCIEYDNKSKSIVIMLEYIVKYFIWVMRRWYKFKYGYFKVVDLYLNKC